MTSKDQRDLLEKARQDCRDKLNAWTDVNDLKQAAEYHAASARWFLTLWGCTIPIQDEDCGL